MEHVAQKLILLAPKNIDFAKIFEWIQNKNYLWAAEFCEFWKPLQCAVFKPQRTILATIYTQIMHKIGRNNQPAELITCLLLTP